MKKFGLILLVFLCTQNIIQAQDATVTSVRFSQLESYLNRKSDSVYVINFWATWCGPCRKELPEMEKIHRQYSDKKVKVLLVSLDFPAQLNTGVVPFLKSNDITASVVLLNEPDGNTWIDKVDPGWSGSLPATLIYRGTDRVFHEKELTYEEINRSVISFL